jgi:hypothetical protein
MAGVGTLRQIILFLATAAGTFDQIADIEIELAGIRVFMQGDFGVSHVGAVIFHSEGDLSRNRRYSTILAKA